MRIINKLDLVGNDIVREEYLPVPSFDKEYVVTRFLSKDEVDELHSLFNGEYEHDLRCLFTYKGEVNLATKVYFDLDPDLSPLQERRLAIDLTPKAMNGSQNHSYNTIVSELLIKENSKYNWYLTAEKHEDRLAKRILRNQDDEKHILEIELKRINELFPESRDGLLLRDGGLKFEYDRADSRASFGGQLIIMYDLFTYLEAGKTVNFNQFINWVNHLLILNFKEVILFKKHLKKRIADVGAGKQGLHLSTGTIVADNKKLKPKPKEFVDLFKDVSKYAVIKDRLAMEGLIDPQTLVCVDEGKGIKGLLVAILKDLKAKGYYKDEISTEITDFKAVAANTFKIAISLDSMKSRGKKHDTSFIPYASELP